MESQVQVRFSEFYEQWLKQHEDNLKELLSLPRDSSHDQLHRALVFKVGTHYKKYYTVKWAAAKDDVLGFFCPTWFSPLEIAYHWMTGWKPSMIFRLITTLRQTQQVPGASLADMTEEQLKKIQDLHLRIRIEEDRVEREMERQQVSIADKPMVELARLATQVKNGEVEGELDKYVDATLCRLLAGLEQVMKMADCVRLKALKGVLEVLNPLQSVDFLAATAMLQIQLRRAGKRRDHGKVVMDQDE